MRRRLVIVAAVVVAAAVAGALAVRWLADDEAVVDGPAAEAGACPEVSLAEDDLYQLPEPAKGAPDEIPDGAERVWMCTGPGGGLDAPRDALTTDVDALATVINELPSEDRGDPMECAADGGPIYILRFQYDDGAVADAAGELFGCGVVQVGDTWRPDGRKWTAAVEFVRMLREQRAGSRPPSLTAEPVCGRAQEQVVAISPIGKPAEMATAVLCRPESTAVPIPEGDLALLLADHDDNRSTKSPTAKECRSDREVTIQGLTAWGDRVSMAGYCGVFVDGVTRPSADADGGVPDYWRPGAEARAVLDGLFGTQSTAVAPCPANPDTPLDADLPDGEAGVVPPGASWVRLCAGPGVGLQEPVDALTDGVDEIAELISGLELLDLGRGCTAELGVGYRLVFSYPDGSALDATGRLYGCDDVDVAGAILTPAEVPWNAFRDALREQRRTATPPRRLPGPSCRPYGDLGSPIATAADMTRAVLCLTTRDGEATHRSRMKGDDLRVLLNDVTAVGEPDPACTADPVPIAIRGMTAWGDRVVLSGVCGLLVDSGPFPEGPATYWRPGAQAQAVLDRLVEQAEKLRRID